LDDVKERELVPERVSIARYRELLDDEADDLSDEDIEIIAFDGKGFVRWTIVDGNERMVEGKRKAAKNDAS